MVGSSQSHSRVTVMAGSESWQGHSHGRVSHSRVTVMSGSQSWQGHSHGRVRVMAGSGQVVWGEVGMSIHGTSGHVRSGQVTSGHGRSGLVMSCQTTMVKVMVVTMSKVRMSAAGNRITTMAVIGTAMSLPSLSPGPYVVPVSQRPLRAFQVLLGGPTEEASAS